MQQELKNKNKETKIYGQGIRTLRLINQRLIDAEDIKQ